MAPAPPGIFNGVRGMYRKAGFRGRQDLVGAILMAGGPSDRANLSKVRLIRPDDDGRAEMQRINLNKFLEKGQIDSNPKLRPGDTVEVGKKGFTGRDMTLLLSFVTALGTAVLLYYSIQREAKTSN